MLLAVALLLALGAWAFMFLPPRRGVWTRTWITAVVLSAFSVAALAAQDRLDDVLSPVDLGVVAAGLGIGAAWLVATHVGHFVLSRLIPGFAAQVDDLYRLRDDAPVALQASAVGAMGVAEELLFRGFVQDGYGLAAGVAAYTAVQVVERKWALGLAALLGGLVWGLAYWATGGLLAPVLAHVLWTGLLTFVWRLPGTAPAQPTPVSPRTQEVT